VSIEDRFEGLQAYTEQGFERIHQAIGRLDGTIDGVAARLDAKIDAAEARLDVKIGDVEQRLTTTIEQGDRSLHVRIEANSERLDTVAEGLQALGERMDRMEARQDKRHEELMGFLHNVLGDHEVRIQRLEKSGGFA
jgi:hypothetical protein